MLTLNSATHNIEEKGHREDVNLNSNVSAKYVVSFSLLVLPQSLYKPPLIQI